MISISSNTPYAFLDFFKKHADQLYTINVWKPISLIKIRYHIHTIEGINTLPIFFCFTWNNNNWLQHAVDTDNCCNYENCSGFSMLVYHITNLNTIMAAHLVKIFTDVGMIAALIIIKYSDNFLHTNWGSLD